MSHKIIGQTESLLAHLNISKELYKGKLNQAKVT